MNRASGLWVHQESAIILADSHDVWSFTPEFLLANEIVPESWRCLRARRTGNSMEIQYGRIHWRMTEGDLWITHFPDCTIEGWHSTEDARLVPAMAERYLENVRHSPFSKLWLYWRLSVVNPNRNQWMLDNFLDKELQERFRITRMQPVLDFSIGDTEFQITVRTAPGQRQFENFEDSIVFDCYAYQAGEQDVDDMVLESARWSDRLNELEEALNHLLGESRS